MPHRLESGDLRQQPGILRVHTVAQDVQFVSLLLRGQLYARDELDGRRLARLRRSGAALHRIVVRQRNGRKPIPPGLLGQFLRPIRAVGKTAVQM